MLPEDLSNNLCSLKQNSPKKAVVVKMHLDHRGCKIKHEFIRGIITIEKNYSYEIFNIGNDDLNLSIDSIYEKINSALGGSFEKNWSMLLMKMVYHLNLKYFLLIL